ncbi:MAG: sporulation protein YqfD [Clostridia bacterium]|nr:sporulation protein YqfD [Clostridia bacterium]
MSSVDILIKGRNRLLVIEKLKRANVSILNIDQKTETEFVIRVRYKDYNKAIAILENVWYNKTVKYNGGIGFIRFLAGRAALIISALAFILAALFIDNVMLFTEVNGVSVYHEARINSLLKESGAQAFSTFSSIDLSTLEKSILADNELIAFVSLKKRGNTLVVDAEYKSEAQMRGDRPQTIFARHSGVITSLTVLRGRALKSVGDFVYSGEPVVEGVIEDGEEFYQSYAVAYFTVECKFEYSTVIFDTNEKTVEKELIALRSIFDREDAAAEISFSESGEDTILNITLTFSVTEGYMTESGG